MDNEIMTQQQAGAILAATDIKGAPVGARYCSIPASKDRKTAATVYKAINNPNHKVSDYINKQIAIENLIIENVELASEQTCELVKVPRIIIVDDNGESYTATSMGIYNAVCNMVTCFGEPPYKPAIVATVKQVPVKLGSMLTLDIEG